jgi:salicylate hydroxylase
VDFHIGIIGSGPAGLTTAIALEKAAPPSVRITIVDRNKSSIDYPGVEYGIQERACRALERLGVKEVALSCGHRTDNITLFNAKTNRKQHTAAIDPEYTVNVLRQEFLEEYTRLLTRTQVLREHHVESIELLEKGRVRAIFTEDDGRMLKPIDFDCLISCDGIRSVARRQFFPNTTTYDRGFSGIYLLIDASAGDSREPEHFRELANGPTNLGLMGTFAVNFLFPQGKDRMTLGLGFDHATRARLWQESGLDPQTPWAEIATDVKKSIAQRVASDTPIHGNVLSKALNLVPDWNSHTVYHWIMRDSDPLPTPFINEANVILIGDAAHAFLPTIGMGASLAIEDAERLGTAMGRYLTSSSAADNPGLAIQEKVFVPFVRDRYPIWEDLMWRARTAAQNWIAVDRRKRFRVSPHIPTWWGARLVSSYEWVADRVKL